MEDINFVDVGFGSSWPALLLQTRGHEQAKVEPNRAVSKTKR